MTLLIPTVTMTLETLQDRIGKFLRTQFGGQTDQPLSLAPSDDLFEQGLIDSMGVLQLVGFLEDELGVTIADDEIVVRNFRTIDAIAAFVKSKGAKTGIEA